MSYEERKKYWDEVGKYNDWCDVATQGELNPLDDDDLAGYINALADHLDYEVQESGRHVEDGSLVSEFYKGAVVMTQFLVQDAAVMWVRERYGEDVSGELESALENDETVAQLAKKLKESE